MALALLVETVLSTLLALLEIRGTMGRLDQVALLGHSEIPEVLAVPVVPVQMEIRGVRVLVAQVQRLEIPEALEVQQILPTQTPPS